MVEGSYANGTNTCLLTVANGEEIRMEVNFIVKIG